MTLWDSLLLNRRGFPSLVGEGMSQDEYDMSITLTVHFNLRLTMRCATPPDDSHRQLAM